jgi:hypothetical protein
MYIECHGRGAPTVVLVSGARGPYDDWTHVIDSVREVVGAARKKACALGARNHGQCIKAEKLARR